MIDGSAAVKFVRKARGNTIKKWNLGQAKVYVSAVCNDEEVPTGRLPRLPS